jgi:ferredoxin
MKWPIIEEKYEGPYRILRTEYLTRTTELILDRIKCTVCGQCIRVCPKDALARPKIPKWKKVAKESRDPILPDSGKCVFCGVCMALCPVSALSMKLDNNPLTVEDLPLTKSHILPQIQSVQIGEVKLRDPEFSNNFWMKIMDRLVIKKPVK